MITRQMRDARSTVSSDIDIDIGIGIETAAVDTLQIAGPRSNANAQSLRCVSNSPEEKLCCWEDYELSRFGYVGGFSKSMSPIKVLSETCLTSDAASLPSEGASLIAGFNVQCPIEISDICDDEVR